MLKKQTSLLLTCGNRHPFHSKRKKSKTSSLTSLLLFQYLSCRPYASTSGSHNNGREKIDWPDVTSVNSIPTPYEIFNQKKNSPYSKHRFYELVKLYHPDRHDTDLKLSGLSAETRLERFRLVVAANNILGDPARRSAYDRYGAGWNGKPHISNNDYSSNDAGYSSWKRWPDGPSRNASWEDWEKWYARDGAPQDPNYVSNSAFVGLILTFALLGGVGQATRATNHSFDFLEQRNALHNKVSMELTQIRKESTDCKLQEERIYRFMRNRDPRGFSIEGSKDIIERPHVSTDLYPRKDPKGD
ncbi:putative hsp40p co-chaperone [Golovinomyces cichoracearum]|uniref:Putative hsp40p co-chaperone n=1 Tax=Golovinomyces cichoracearum TaxID=62708 RepID=A0A420HNU3_9PEZI|nr:putative hsp40p co-chaperone [Golovinomyces cichoracearum]